MEEHARQEPVRDYSEPLLISGGVTDLLVLIHRTLPAGFD